MTNYCLQLQYLGNQSLSQPSFQFKILQDCWTRQRDMEHTTVGVNQATHSAQNCSRIRNLSQRQPEIAELEMLDMQKPLPEL